jgi:RNA polymerase sigma-70 factor (ECF subfamily)
MSNILKEKFLLYRIRAKKDPDAFGEIYDTYVQRIYRFVFFKVRSAEQAEDLTSETFLKAWDYLKKKDDVPHLQALLYSIARSAVVDWYRRTANESGTVTLDDERVTGLADLKSERLFQDIESRDQVDQVIERLHRLKDEWREVMVMKHLDGLSNKEIAAAVGKTPANVRVILHRATKALTESLSNDELQATTTDSATGKE